MSISSSKYGVLPSGEEICLYIVDNGKGLRAEFLNLGCVLRSLVITDKNGRETDVVLGRKCFEDYIKNVGNFGATVGRCANRIYHGEFEINGVVYKGEPNQRGHLLHSGWANFAVRAWQASYESDDANAISFELQSPDGENGFPGDLNAVVTFTLEDKSLNIHYEAVANKDTIMNLTNHSYFNLNGHDSGDVLGHELRIDADFYTPFDDECIPTGEILSVRDTVYDFTQSHTVGKYINPEAAEGFRGYDDNFVLRGTGLREVSCLRGDKTGISMITYTNKPGLQVYTPLFLDGSKEFKDGVCYKKCQGICLETQFFPNTPGNSHFPSSIVKCGEKYDYTTIYEFDTE